MKARLFSLLALISSCWANSPIEDVTSTFSSLPRWSVADCVSPTSGQYFISESDLTIRGAEPLSIPRNYLSFDQYGKGGWSDFNHLYLHIQKIGNSRFHFSTHDTSGIPLFFGNEGSRNGKTYPLNNKEYEGSLLNTAIGKVGGRTNLKNAYATYENSICQIHMPDGSVRVYGKRKSKERSAIQVDKKLKTLRTYTYLLTEERLPNGNRIIYEWKGEKLKSIVTSGPNKETVYAVVQFEGCKLSTSDGREGKYSFSQVEVTGRPTELLDYQGPRVSQRAFEGGPFTEIHYCQRTTVSFKNEYKRNGRNYREWGDRIVWPSNAVKSISDGAGEYNFSYKTLPSPGVTRETEVIDPEGGKTIYRVGLGHIPKEIISYNAEGCLLRTIEYTWERDNLKRLTFKNENNRSYKTLDYEYDTRHNIRRETLLRKDVEASTEYRYNSSNLPIWKKEPSGKITTTDYLPNTNLPTLILVGDGNKIYERQFFTYNQDNILIESIQDDGISKDPSSLRNVTYRKIKRIKPHRAGEISTKQNPIPALNLPGEIFEYYYENGQEQLLTRTRYTYDNHARITEKEIIDADNTPQYTLHYAYDEKDRLIAETNALGQTTSYTYDNQNNCLSEKHPYKNLKIERTYDERNCLTSETYIDLKTGEQETTHYAYDRKKRKISETDPRSTQTNYRYNSDDLITEKELPDGTLWTYTYDANSNCIEETDGRDFITKTSYNTHGQKTHILYPDQTEEYFQYNLDGTLASHTDQVDRITHYTYDILGRKTEITLTLDEQIISTETYRYKGPNLIYKELPGERITTYNYDGAGRLTFEKTGEKEKKYQYDSLGRICKTIERERVYVQHYDLLSRPIQEEHLDLTGTLYSTIHYTYDGHNNKQTITKWIDNEPSTTTYTYNGLNQLIQKTDPLGRKTKISYQNSDHNLIKKITQPNQTYRIETYDPQIRLLKKEWYNKEDKRLRYETHTYDLSGNLIQTTIKPKNQTIAYTYDPSNRKISQLESSTKKTTFTYTPDSLQNLIIKPDNVEIHKTYTPHGQLKTLTSSDNSIAYKYEYDERNRLTKVYDHDNPCLKRSYDDQDRLTKEKFLNHYSLTKTYDIYDRTLTLTYPDGQTATYSYDPYNLKTVEYSDLTHTYENYDTNSLPLTENLPAGLGIQTHTYDLLLRETKRANPYQTETYTFDTSSNLITRTLNNQIDHYNYDDLNQLTSENSHTYTYDTHYNRQSKDNQTYSLTPLDQVTQTAVASYTYDLNGNPITKQTSAGTTYYTYDALNRLITTQTPNQTHHYSYDPFNRRLSANNSNFIYDNRKEIGKIISNKITERRILGNSPANEIGATILYEINNKLQIPLHSIDGNIIALLNPDGTPTQNLTYSAFGETTPTNLPWTYQSKRQDPTGLIYFGSRYYDPDLGRFLTPDPAGFTDSYNLYSYLLNRPFVAVDPNGEEALAIAVVLFGAEAGAVTFSGGTLLIAYAVWKTYDCINNWSEVRQARLFHERAIEASKRDHKGGFSQWDQLVQLSKSSKKTSVGGAGGGDDGDGGDDDWYKKNDGRRAPKSREVQNRQAEAAKKEIERKIGRKISRDQGRQFHDHITKQGYSYQELVEEGIMLFGGS